MKTILDYLCEPEHSKESFKMNKRDRKWEIEGDFIMEDGLEICRTASFEDGGMKPWVKEFV